ncbi:MAG TPA: Spy/CpxP family protein refolding chaperone [Bacteroidales bacterium]|nr:Spy/CpxP family protein refolding chaperone [Bacteroidales bacterium]
MRTKNLIIITALAMFIGVNMVAQPNQENPPMKCEKAALCPFNNEMGIPGLTTEQSAKLKELKLAHYKEVQPVKNQLKELKAKQHTLTTAEKPDMKAINANIDEITKLENTLMKARAAHIQQIRALLTDEQRMIFDSRKHKPGKKGMQIRHNRMEHAQMPMKKCEMNVSENK